MRSRRPKIYPALAPLGGPETDRIRDTAVHAARVAGEIQMHRFRSPGLACRKLLHDVKLDIDLRCERSILSTLRESFPDHAVWTEESGRLPGTGRCTWVVDPLDGTVNFWQGLPIFCVSIACYRNDLPPAAPGLPGAPVVGVVYLPCSRELFVGVRGRGSVLNDRRVGVSAARELGDLVLAVSFGKTPERMRRMADRLAALLPQVRKGRCLGAAAAELAYVSAGYLGGVIYDGLKPWDFAAGQILVEESGGFLNASETEPGHWRVTAGPAALEGAITSLLSS
jgi:fructose-1,6-bisphosphatase/inositol monophosphatase family enzyme